MMDTKEKDLQLWNEYHATHSPIARDRLLKRMEGLIQTVVNKWSGTLPMDYLKTEASLLAIKAFDTFEPSKGVALSTYVVNNLAPISRLVYTYSNSARVPENIALKMNTYHQAVDHLTTIYGRSPTTDEIHSFTGFNSKEIGKLKTMGKKDLIESGGNITSDFYSNKEDSDADAIFALYSSLTPDEKTLFEYITGFLPHQPKLSNAEIIDKLGITQAQLSYRKTQLTNKIHKLTNGK